MTYLGPSLRRRTRRAKPWLRGAAAVALSLLVNGFALHVIETGSLARGLPQVTRPVVLAPLSAAQWEANRRGAVAAPSSRLAQERLASPAPATPPAPAPVPADRKQGQVVDLAPPKNATPPKDSRFLAEHDSTVEKETRSRHARPGYENTLAKPSERQAPRPASSDRERSASAGEGGREGARMAGGRRVHDPASPATRLPEQPEQPKLALKLQPSGDLRMRALLPGARARPSAQGEARQPMDTDGPGEGGEAGRAGTPGPLGNLQLRPTAASYDRLAGGPAPDRLDGVEEGDGTFLNARGWKYASYFNRISQAVRVQWDPNTAMRTRDPSGTRFSSRDWHTVLVVKLDDHGSLKDVAVERSSGLDFLDSAAVQALRRAQPFVNPPRGLADERGEIVFSYGFTLQGSFGLEHLFRRGPQ